MQLFSGCNGRNSWVLLLGASLSLACGSTTTQPDDRDATGGSEDQASGGSVGGEGGGSGGQNVGSGGTIEGIGNGERDATCRTRTSNHVGGERIVLRNGITSEGDQVFLGFYDTERKLECSIRQDAEGKFRCMPLTRGDKDRNNLYFLDATCSNEVDYRGICALDHDAVPVSDDPKDQRRRFFALGDSLPDSAVYSKNAEGVCEAYGTLNHLRTIGPELDPHDFAEVDPVVWRGAGRIWEKGYKSDDGLQVVDSLLDSQFNHSCDFTILSDGAEHCTPAALGILGFTDSSCKENLVTGFESCEAPLSCYASARSGGVCGQGRTYLKAVERYEGENYLARSCSIAMNQEAVTYTTEKVPDSAFLEAESTTSAEDSGRLRAMYRDTDDGGCFFRGWWDEELQTPCTFGQSGGKYYCLPNAETTSSSVIVPSFSDAACEEEALYLEVQACSGVKAPLFSVVSAQTCDGSWRDVRAVTPDPAATLTIWIKEGDACSPYLPQPGKNYHALGNIMDASSFVEAIPER